MTDSEQKNLILEILETEIRKPIEQQSSWKTHLYFCPSIALFILNDKPISSKNVFEILKAGWIIYDGIKIHQGDNMPSYRYNIEKIDNGKLLLIN